MQSSRRKFLYAASAAAAFGGIFESGCKNEQRRLAVLLHGMMIIDVRGFTIKAFMPMVPGPKANEQAGMHQQAAVAGSKATGAAGAPSPAPAPAPAPAPGAYPQYGHDYCVTPDSKVAHEINLCPKTVEMAQYRLAGIGADRGKPAFLPDQHIVLKNKGPEDLSVNPACVVACMELPFPNRIVPLRQAHVKAGGSITNGGDAGNYNAQPTSMPLVYGLVYELEPEEKPFIVGMDGGRLWSQSYNNDHVHVHAEPRYASTADHFSCLAKAFYNQLKLDVADACHIQQDPADGSALGVPIQDVELYGLAGPPQPADFCAKGPDPGNCGSVVVDDGSGN
jgi:hypothetical protein